MAAFPKDTRRSTMVVNLEYIHRGSQGYGVTYRRQVFDGPAFQVGNDVRIKNVHAIVMSVQHQYDEYGKWSTVVGLGMWNGDLDSLRELGFSKKPEN